MNVFEDLIGELKSENLLEDTVIEVHQPSKPGEHDTEFEFAGGDDFPIADQLEDDELPGIETTADDLDIYRKRAMEEVSSLQMVEHVFSGVEREYMKMVPATFDDLEANKALHRLLQVAAKPVTPEHADAESALLCETEAWHAALYERDARISVANIRRFCENSRPGLSSQALLALARFYRNSVFSESVRGKFDFVMTRLFSHKIDGDKRRLLFGRMEMIGHIKPLYDSWASVLLFPAASKDTGVQASVARFEKTIADAESTDTFDELIRKDFFDRMHKFKESTCEMFFVPEVLAAAIDCNVRIGNKFVDLIQNEKAKSGIDGIEEKYGHSYDQIVSQAAGRTLRLVDVLRDSDECDEDFEDEQAYTEAPLSISPLRVKKESSITTGLSLFGVNKWVLAAAVLAVVMSVGIYFWADRIEGEQSVASVAKTIDIGDTDFKQYLQTARVSETTFYALTLPSWDILTETEQKEILQKVLKFAGNYKVEQVELLNAKGRTVAFASKDRNEILAQ